MPAGLIPSLAWTLIPRYGLAMSPRVRELLRRLKVTSPKEYAELFRKGPYNTLRNQRPLPTKEIDQPHLQTLYKPQTRHAVLNTGRTTRSRPELYLNLSTATTQRNAPRWAPGTHWLKPKHIPEKLATINFQQRGQILRVQQGKSARYRDEGNRQRRDKKAKRYIQALQFVNRTYGTYTEVAEVAYAWKNSATLSDFVEAIAINEAIDRLYGTRARLLKKHIYNKPWYKLPVGLDMGARIGKSFIT